MFYFMFGKLFCIYIYIFLAIKYIFFFQPVYQEPFQNTNMQRGAAITLNISESNKSGSAGTVSIGHVQTCSRPEVGPNSRPDIGPKSEKSPYHSSGASDDNNSADNLKILNEPATLQLVRKGRKTTFFT